MKRFNLETYEKLCKLAYVKDSVKAVFDIGFVQIEKGQVKGLYALCLFHSGHSGFIKFMIDNSNLVLQSFYYTMNPNVEVRYDAQTGEEIAQYVNYPDGNNLVYSKIVRGAKVDEYVINKDDVGDFEEYQEIIKPYVEGSLSKFHYFEKEGQEVVYLFIR